MILISFCSKFIGVYVGAYANNYFNINTFDKVITNVERCSFYWTRTRTLITKMSDKELWDINSLLMLQCTLLIQSTHYNCYTLFGIVRRLSRVGSGRWTSSVFIRIHGIIHTPTSLQLSLRDDDAFAANARRLWSRSVHPLRLSSTESNLRGLWTGDGFDIAAVNRN